MKYPAPNGHMVESLPYPQEVTYNCECSTSEYSDGILYSDEIKGNSTEIGIQGVHITRIIDNGNMTIKIKEFSDEELINYINNNTI